MTATLYRIKPRFQRLLEPIVVGLARRRVGADSVTWAGLGLSGICGALALAGAATPGLLLAVPVVLLARMAANAVDGQLARRNGPTRRGAVLNEVCDVAGDSIAYLPFAAVVAGGSKWLVVAVVVAGLVVEMAAVSGPGARRNAGPLGKSDRALAFSLVAVAVGVGVEGLPLMLGLGVTLVLAIVTIANRMRAL